MTPEELRAALNAIITDKIVFSWWQVLAIALLAGGGAYAGAYFKKRGENLATKADLQDLTSKVESIKTEYAQRLEDYKAEIKRREDAIQVAAILAEFLYGKSSDRGQFMTSVWKLSLILPPDAVTQLSTTLVETKDGIKDPKDLLVCIRKHLHGKEDPITSQALVHFTPEDLMPKPGSSTKPSSPNV